LTFSNTKPDSGKSPKIDVTQLQTDFSEWARIWAINHTPMNNRNQGDHANVIFTLQTSDPGVTQDLDVLYIKNVVTNSTPAPGQPQLFVQIPKFLPTKDDPTAAPNAPMQLTFNSVNTSGPVYQSFLPGGYLLYFGSTSNIAVPITLVPAPTKILVAIATANNMNPPTLVPGGSFGGDIVTLPYDVWTTITNNSTFKINSNLNLSGPVVAYSFGWVAIALQ
jgi:hypothetical protein